MTDEFLQAVKESRVFYRRQLARAIALEIVRSAGHTAPNYMVVEEVSAFCTQVAEAVTKKLQEFEDGPQ